jgi:hypothetical protein
MDEARAFLAQALQEIEGQIPSHKTDIRKLFNRNTETYHAWSGKYDRELLRSGVQTVLEEEVAPQAEQ